jgi:hypothetical protein
MASTLTGGCMCGAVRYECSAEPVMAANCYCTDCQHSSGGAFASVALVPKAAFKMTKGNVKHHEVTADSGNKLSRGFCAECGSPILSLIGAMPDLVGIKAGSLDDPSKFKPGVNIFMSSAPPWAPVVEGLPKFAKGPG